MAQRTILCFGDSNTHGSIALATPDDMGRHDAAIRWTGVMAAALGAGYNVIEEGHPGRTTVFPDPLEGAYKSGLAVLPALLESHRPIDLVVIMLGTNDLKARFSMPAADIATGTAKLLECVARMRTPIGVPPPRALLVAPVPIIETGLLVEMFRGGAAKSRTLAAYYQTIATRAGAAFADAGSVASVDPVDGIHLTAEAHAAIGAYLAGAVRAALT